MKMIIGGAFQGKLAYGESLYPDIKWMNGEECSFDEIKTCRGIYNFHKYILRIMKEEKEDEYLDILKRLPEINPKLVLISEEIGYGLVPMDPFERRYREQVGRICTSLASASNRVDRVICGIGIVIRGRSFDMAIELEQVKPTEIEKRSFEIITEELGDVKLIPGTQQIVKRCIHTSADFEYAKNLTFSDGVVQKGIEAIKNGASIVTDTQMAKAGINKKQLQAYGGQVHCFMSDEDVAEEALSRGSTRAAISMEKAARLEERLIFAIGNAPTALVRLYEMITAGEINPVMIIAAPVGFVNVVQAKELILGLPDTPYIVARGRKGGSNIAACICNALLYYQN